MSLIKKLFCKHVWKDQDTATIRCDKCGAIITHGDLY
jgi:hypothetical protein